MLIKFKRIPAFVLVLLLFVFISGCDQNKQTETTAKIEAIEYGDECFICGMEIKRFPGPKGQALLHHSAHPIKFCSSNELLGWLLQPDTPGVLHSAYVHDMGKATSWATPNDDYYIDVKKAWYVIGHSQKGAMGVSLASFTKKQDAQKFKNDFGGRLIGYSEIDNQMLINSSP